MTMHGRRIARTFHPGDEVELVAGSYQGTAGVFVGLRADPNWADIAERDGTVRGHPVVWLDHAGAALARRNAAWKRT